jgi:uncharacterized protein (TIRG00374 family)
VSRAKAAVSAALVAATLAGTWWFLGRYAGGLSGIGSTAARIGARDWAVILAATIAFYLLDWIRFQSLLALFGAKLSPWRGFRLTCISYFVSSLTPSSELHPPVIAYFLVREGVTVPVAAAVTSAKSLYMVLWICLFAFMSLQGQSDVRLPQMIAGKLALVTSPLLFIAAGLAALAFFPEKARGLFRAQADRPGVPAWRRRLCAALEDFTTAISRIGRSTDAHHLVCHAASALFVLTYVFIGWSLCRAAGIPIGPRQALAAFSNSLLVVYLAPVPGSVGITEAATAYLIDPSMPAAAVSVAFLLRTLCWYVVMPPGALLMALEIKDRGLAAFAHPGRAGAK